MNAGKPCREVTRILRRQAVVVTEFGAFGTPEMIRERMRLYRSVGISCLGVRIDGPLAERMSTLEQVVDIACGV